MGPAVHFKTVCDVNVSRLILMLCLAECQLATVGMTHKSASFKGLHQLTSLAPPRPELRTALAEAIDKLNGHNALLASPSILDYAIMNDDQTRELYAKADHIISRAIIGAIKECGSIEEFRDWLYALDSARFQHVATDLIALATHIKIGSLKLTISNVTCYCPSIRP